MVLRCTSPWLEVMFAPAPRPAAVTSPWPELTRHLRAFGNSDGKIQAATVIALGFYENGVAADSDVRLFGVEDFLGFGVGVGEGDFMRLHLNRGGVTRGHADVATRILDLDDGVGRDLRVENLLILVALGQAEEVEKVVVVIVVAPLGAHRSPEAVPSGSGKAKQREEHENADKSAATSNRSGSTEIEGPLAEKREAGGDEKQRPPVAVPGPEIGRRNAAAINQEAHNTDADEDDGTDDRWDVGAVSAPIAGFPHVSLCLPCFALRAPCSFLLFAIGAPLSPWIVRRNTPGGV